MGKWIKWESKLVDCLLHSKNILLLSYVICKDVTVENKDVSHDEQMISYATLVVVEGPLFDILRTIKEEHH